MTHVACAWQRTSAFIASPTDFTIDLGTRRFRLEVCSKEVFVSEVGPGLRTRFRERSVEVALSRFGLRNIVDPQSLAQIVYAFSKLTHPGFWAGSTLWYWKDGAPEYYAPAVMDLGRVFPEELTLIAASPPYNWPIKPAPDPEDWGVNWL